MINYSICIMSAKPGIKKADISAQTGGTKAYGSAQANAKLTYDQFVQHMADHNTPFSKGTISGVLTDMIRCLREQLLAGNVVSLGELGSFRVELSCEGAETTEEFGAANIKAVNVCWAPGKDFKNLREDAEFQLVPSRKMQGDAIEVIKNTDTIQGLE